jgi:hypothetical protein
MNAQHVAAGIVSVIVVVAIGGCGRDGEKQDVEAAATTTKRQTIADATLQGYPPRKDAWNLAVAIDDPRLRAAAEFAAETESLIDRSWLDLEDADALRSRYAPGMLSELYPHDVPQPLQTGGATFRAVAVVPTNEGRIAVTICEYATPGVFVRGPGDRLVLRSFATDRARFTFTTSTVEWTTDGDGRGRSTTEPRWLVVHEDATTWGDAAKAVCEPHLPTPFEFVPPLPTSTTTSGTR